MNKQKQFGIWMDNHQAAIVGNENEEDGPLTLLAHVNGEHVSQDSHEKNINNHEKTAQTRFFKEIASHLVNATHVYVTGTQQAQEQFIHFLAETPQFKNCETAESTSNKMSDEKLVEYMSSKF
ncbi:MAG TPA: hypothetical protein DIW47_10210 [Bacteroidetes bacterium]|nr:hypothetical protein [Bacteroidota bacterium]